ncbi:MAG: M48 family metallopeptidase [Hyphomicrobium sp.]|jgi:predicted Zn-dependent protease|nr:M48 family metallopeptidase [Hyphomicrobium sp.]
MRKCWGSTKPAGRLALSVAFAITCSAGLALANDGEGVKVPRKSMFNNLVSADSVEKSAALQYSQMTRQAYQQRKLLPANDPRTIRVRRIADNMLPYTKKFNDRSDKWDWEVNVFDSPNINAFCMPGGKIAVFTGIIDKLQLTDDELAVIIGHEMGHALWEHARERTAKVNITNIGSRLVGGLLFGQAGELVGAAGSSLAALKFSRNDETEADLIGMELAARAGYDPRAGITLWQKMSKAAGGAPPQWLSTHPSGAARIKTFQDNLKDVMPLYEKARAARSGPQ